jgi:hypothetical protein
MERPRSIWLCVTLLVAACGQPSSGGDLALPDRSASEGIAFPDLGARGEATPDDLQRADAALTLDAPTPLPALSLYVNLGDSLGAGYNASSGHSYKALLLQNDNLLYPTYAGRDLKSRFPKIVVVDKAKSGARSGEVLTQAKNVTGNPAGATLVVVSAGGNDFNDSALVMIDPIQTAAVAKKATENLKKIVDHFSNPLAFPGGFVLVLLNIHDPTDGHGSIAPRPNLSGFCDTILKLGLLAGPVVVKNLGVMNGAYAALAGANPIRPVDNHAAFLGHGFHFDDPASPSYHPGDPTLWFANDCAHGNDRGHHELRRLIWKALTGEQ